MIPTFCFYEGSDNGAPNQTTADHVRRELTGGVLIVVVCVLVRRCDPDDKQGEPTSDAPAPHCAFLRAFECAASAADFDRAQVGCREGKRSSGRLGEHHYGVGASLAYHTSYVLARSGGHAHAQARMK